MIPSVVSYLNDLFDKQPMFPVSSYNILKPIYYTSFQNNVSFHTKEGYIGPNKYQYNKEQTNLKCNELLGELFLQEKVNQSSSCTQ
jgi:hypothetical protein